MEQLEYRESKWGSMDQDTCGACERNGKPACE